LRKRHTKEVLQYRRRNITPVNESEHDTAAAGVEAAAVRGREIADIMHAEVRDWPMTPYLLAAAAAVAVESNLSNLCDLL
jgi:hypothetical protein